MKKILTSALLSLSLVSLASTETVALASTGAVTGTGTSTGAVLEVVSATTGSGENALVNPVENLSYTYYYGQTCPYCQRLDKYLESVDGYNKLNIDKREVWHNRENAVKMSEDLKRLGLSNSNSVGVPFLIINDAGKEISLSGLDNIIAYFEPILGKYNEAEINSQLKTIEQETKAIQEKAKEKMIEENSGKRTIFLVVVLLLAILVPVAFIKFSKK